MPMIVFSNTYLTAMVEQALKAGATKCLSKSSCTPKQVIDAVRATLPNNGRRPGGTIGLAAMPVIAQPPPSTGPLPATPPAPERPAAGETDSEFQSELR